MRAEQTSFLFGANAPFIEELYARYLADPASVDGEWQTFFGALAEQKGDVLAEVRGASWAPNGARVIGAVDPDAVPAAANRNVKGGKAANGATAPAAPAIAGKTQEEIRAAAQDTARALMMIRAYRIRGHLEADLDPLGLVRQAPHRELDPATYGFAEADWDRPILIFGSLALGESASLRQIMERLRKTYCGKIGVEFMHISDPDQKAWIQERIEHIENHTEFTVTGRKMILERVGEGGTATVYRATHPEHGDVAFKVLREKLRQDRTAVARFTREAGFGTRVQHPNVIRTIQTGEDGGVPFLVIEWAPGELLESYAKRHAPFPPDEVATIVSQIASAVFAAHTAGIVHRDLKPDNVMYDHDLRLVKLLDFGIAKLLDPSHAETDSPTLSGMQPMTPEYASPEQLLGQPVTLGQGVSHFAKRVLHVAFVIGNCQMAAGLCQIEPGLTLAALVAQLGQPPQALATAVNGEFVPRDGRGGVQLRDGDAVFTFQPITGG